MRLLALDSALVFLISHGAPPKEKARK